MMSNCMRSVAPVMTTPAEKGLSLLETPGIISSEPINRDHWASHLRANGDLVRKLRRMHWDPCPSCLKTIDERGGQEWRKTVSVSAALHEQTSFRDKRCLLGLGMRIFGHESQPARRD